MPAGKETQFMPGIKENSLMIHSLARLTARKSEAVLIMMENGIRKTVIAKVAAG
jgi:hypothetical protein